jgi:KDO2-lipid IV(A) lauroyltransferase
MRSYLRYFREAFTLSAVIPEQLQARVRVIGEENVINSINQYGGVVATLGHIGNWDLAGAWAAANLAPVLTVAEKLEPESVYQEFLNFRQSIGMEVLGLGDDGVFDQLVTGAKQGKIIALLADRDLTYRGVEVDLCGHKARVAAGPAAVALNAGVPLVPASIHYKRLRGTQRKKAGTPWGIVIEFMPPVYSPNGFNNAADTNPPDSENPGSKGAAAGRSGVQQSLPHYKPTFGRSDVDKQQQIADLTQAWVTKSGEAITNHTADWHMLQKVFVADLDPTRYASTLKQTDMHNEVSAKTWV